jgi:hypothetical protein
VRNLLNSYFWWTYERGSFHYDVLVTLILIFMFVSPRFIDFKDRPTETVALRSSEVLVREAGQVGSSAQFIYQIRTDVAGGPKPSQSDDERRAAILSVVEPISGDVTLERAEPVYDEQKHIVAYDAWVLK